MKRMLCPYCDHEMTKKGICDFCGSRVKKPVYVETSAEFNSQPSAQPNECDCRLHSEEGHDHDDTYRDSEDISFRQDYEASYGSDAPPQSSAVQQGAAAARAAAQAGAGQPRRRAMLASEAVQEVARKGSMTAGSPKIVKRVIIGIATYVAVQIILYIIFSL